MKYRAFTGSFETERELLRFVEMAGSPDSPVPREKFGDEYMFRVMTAGRSGPGEAREGSEAPDDVGGFFVERDGAVFLTEKAKGCLHEESL